MTKTNAVRLVEQAGISFRCTEYAYDEQGRLVQEKTSYVGSDFYVITSYSDFDDWGNWRRSEIQDHLGTPYTFSLRRFSYFD